MEPVPTSARDGDPRSYERPRNGAQWLAQRSHFNAVALILYSALALVVGYAGWLSASSIHLYAANWGQGPLDLLALHKLPAGALAFQSKGLVPSLTYSLPMELYVVLNKVGVDPLAILRVHAFIEPAILATAGAFLSKCLFPNSRAPFHALVGLLISGSNIFAADLGRWTGPNYLALYYIFAQAARLTGIGLIIRGNLIAASLAFAIACACHPLIGGIGCLFGAAVLVGGPRSVLSWRSVSAVALFLVITSLWFWYSGFFGALFGSKIDRGLWLELNRFGSYHLFPFETGVFGREHFKRVIPLLSSLLLVHIYLRRSCAEPTQRKQIAAGLTVLGIVVIIGVIASALPSPVFVLRLTLHRGSDLFLIIAGIIGCYGLWLDIGEGPSWRRVIAAITFLSPLFFFGFPLPLVMLIAAHEIWTARLTEKFMCAHTISLFCLTAAAVGVMVIYSAGASVNTDLERYVGNTQTILMASVAVALVFLEKRVPSISWALRTEVCAGAVLLSIFWFQSHLGAAVYGGREAESYYEAERWAEQATPPASRFMIDPSKHYGWLAFSHRPTFGNVRDWIIWTTTYNYDADAFAEGTRRLRELGLDYHNYLDRKPPLVGMGELIKDARDRFYQLSDPQLAALGQRYGIRYVLYFKNFLHRPPGIGHVVFQNRDLEILELP